MTSDSFSYLSLLNDALQTIVKQIRCLLAEKGHPIVVALDGGSGAGKSTLASIVEKELDTALIPLDDFFSANIPDNKWDEFTVQEKLTYVFDWSRLRSDAIEPLLNGKPAQWYAFDFQSGLYADGTYGKEAKPKALMPAPVILIEGAYSSSPQLEDLMDMAVLIDVPVEKRHARLAAREDPAFLMTWHRRWDEVEAYYFEHVRPKNSFDIVVELK